jgi:hypothetical protein
MAHHERSCRVGLASEHIKSDRSDLLEHIKGSMDTGSGYQNRLAKLAIIIAMPCTRRSSGRCCCEAIYYERTRIQAAGDSMDKCATVLICCICVNRSEVEVYLLACIVK